MRHSQLAVVSVFSLAGGAIPLVACFRPDANSQSSGRSAACRPSRCHVFVTMWLACGVRPCSSGTRLLTLVRPVIIVVQGRDCVAEWQYLLGVVGERRVLEACCSGRGRRS